MPTWRRRNGSGVWTTVLAIDLCPSQPWIARVSGPSARQNTFLHTRVAAAEAYRIFIRSS
jgi:hypothetical protein